MEKEIVWCNGEVQEAIRAKRIANKKEGQMNTEQTKLSMGR